MEKSVADAQLEDLFVDRFPGPLLPFLTPFFRVSRASWYWMLLNSFTTRWKHSIPSLLPLKPDKLRNVTVTTPLTPLGAIIAPSTQSSTLATPASEFTSHIRSNTHLLPYVPEIVLFLQHCLLQSLYCQCTICTSLPVANPSSIGSALQFDT